MADIREQVNTAAQRAFRRMLEHHERTGEWSPALMRDWHAADALHLAVLDLPEWLLDANHDAVMAEMDELADAEDDRLPDIPLATVTESEYRALWGDR